MDERRLRFSGVLAVLVVMAAMPLLAAGQGFSGRWIGDLQGVAATLTLTESPDGSLSGEIDAQGYLYRVRGTVSAGRASGTLLDPQTSGELAFEAAPATGGLELTLVATNPMTGETNRIPLMFRDPSAAGGTQGGGAGAAKVPAELVGVWRMSDSMSSGDATMVTESYLELTADGRFALGGSRAIGGGGGWGGDTGAGGVEESGLWKAEGQVIHIRRTTADPWVPFARYYTEPGKLMLTTGDGSRQLLYRVR